MLCPEVSNFSPPKVITYQKTKLNIESVNEGIKLNKFYKSIIITCPDEIKIPSPIEEMILEDSDYYKLCNCPLTELVDIVFVESFVKRGSLYCLTADSNCIVQNCTAITPDGVLTLHILEFIYQTLGLEGTKRPNNYYEIKIDLKSLKHYKKICDALCKLGNFDFYVLWEPNSEEICPSSIAKYFHDKNIHVAVCSLELRYVSPEITEIPSLEGAEIEEIVEWVGMLSHGANVTPKEAYVSTYTQPESMKPLESSRISILIVKGFLTPTIITQLCIKLSEYVLSRDLNNYWASISIQSQEESLWKWNLSSPSMFQSHNSSMSVFFTKAGQTIYSIGQLKYS
ncbi:unnamed protein product [Parnassius apollo]|uniref:(apollo) hypothetical protein n=1 Tax=Parnassius apollo TaxID=110799 RepID=A0A8S3YB63_PARAO|nr:unnamed protein product [Parnassius apollo]